MRCRLTEATSADDAWLESLRRRAYAHSFEATWGGWDEERHTRQFSESVNRGPVSIINAPSHEVRGRLTAGTVTWVVRGIRSTSVSLPHTGSGTWSTPGGHLDHGETL